MAQQMVDYTKNSILMQSSTAMLAQANLKPRSVLTAAPVGGTEDSPFPTKEASGRRFFR